MTPPRTECSQQQTPNCVAPHRLDGTDGLMLLLGFSPIIVIAIFAIIYSAWLNRQKKK